MLAGTEDADVVETRPVNVVVVMGTDGTVSVDGTNDVGDDT